MYRNLTPTEAARSFCKKYCCCGSLSTFNACNGKVLFSKKICPFVSLKSGKGRISVKKIRYHCLYFCMDGSKLAVKECTNEECPLWPFRLGTNPNYSNETRKLKSKLAKKQKLSSIGLKNRGGKYAK